MIGGPQIPSLDSDTTNSSLPGEKTGHSSSELKPVFRHLSKRCRKAVVIIPSAAALQNSETVVILVAFSDARNSSVLAHALLRFLM